MQNKWYWQSTEDTKILTTLTYFMEVLESIKKSQKRLHRYNARYENILNGFQKHFA